MDIDFHKISVEELYQRFSTHPETVRRIFYSSRMAFFKNALIQSARKCISLLNDIVDYN